MNSAGGSGAIFSKVRTSPKDFFLHLGVVVALYVSAISLLNLLFQTINYAFPDALAGYGDPYSYGIRLAVATLIIIFPLYLLLSWFLAKGYETEPSKRELPIRKWLLYLTLFVAGIAVIVDLVVLVQTFLSGEITSRFALKVLSVIVVAGGIFGYYLYDLRRENGVLGERGRGKMFAWIAGFVVLTSLVGGFAIMGSPMTARAKRFDDRKVSDLQSIQWQIVNFWQQKGSFPKAMTDLEDSISGYRVPRDPEELPYEYMVGEDTLSKGVGTSFKLCATFNRSTIGEKDKLQGRGEYGYGGGMSIQKPIGAYDSYGGVGGIADTWEHEKGRFCFDRKIDPELYPIKVKNL